MDEQVITGGDNVCVDEVTDQVTGLRILQVRRRNGSGVLILDEEFGLELFLVGTRIVEGVGIRHGNHVEHANVR